MADAKLTTIAVDKIEGKFFIPNCQRGYRWDTDEVIRLLDDVYNLKAKSGQVSKNYCLQPVVVKKLGEKFFEVIDGQQRFTTLFIIYNYMDSEADFSLTYETREKSADFLGNIKNRLEHSNENIDYYFMANAYNTVKKWFDEKIKADCTNLKTIRRNFENFFTYNVQVI